MKEEFTDLQRMFKRAWRRVSFRIGTIISIIVFLMAILGPFIAPYPKEGWGIASPETVERGVQPPSLKHPLGTDLLGRDILSRILVGAGYALLQTAIVILVSPAIGFLVGVVAAYYRGFVEKVLNYFTEIFISFPAIIIALALNTIIGRGLTVIILSLVITWWSWYARITYVRAREVREMDYVVLAEISGVPGWKIILRHIIPNSTTPVLVQAITDIGSVLLEASSINFLGLGFPAGFPDWGVMVHEGLLYIYSYPWVSLIPGFFILVSALGFSLVGDSLREELDPRLRRRWRLWF